MKLHILGSGTCIPYGRRGSSGYALETGSNKILLDCGNGTTWKLEQKGIDYLDIDHIFISHFHPDHTSDLVPFLFATKYNNERSRTKPLTLWGPTGFRDFFESLNSTFNSWISFEGLEIMESEQREYSLGDLNINFINTPHTKNSLACRIISEEKSLVYTGDTDYSPALGEFAHGCDVLLIECAFPDGQKVNGHLLPEEAAMIIERARPGKAVITHMYPVCDRVDLEKQLRKRISCQLIIAEDMMVVEV